MTPNLRKLWARHPVLLAAFVLAAGLSVFFTGRIVIKTVYWATHREEQIAPWMTLGYVGRSWGLDPRALGDRAGLPLPDRGHAPTLQEIARDLGLTEAEVLARVEEAVTTLRAGQGHTAP